MRTLRICRLGFAAPGKLASGLFSARTGRQALEERARGKSVGESVGFEGPEIVPVAQSHRKAGRKALERGQSPRPSNCSVDD